MDSEIQVYRYVLWEYITIHKCSFIIELYVGSSKLETNCEKCNN
jgi:hypothetical protein